MLPFHVIFVTTLSACSKFLYVKQNKTKQSQSVFMFREDFGLGKDWILAFDTDGIYWASFYSCCIKHLMPKEVGF